MFSSTKKFAVVGVLAVGIFLAGAALLTAHADSSSSNADASTAIVSSSVADGGASSSLDAASPAFTATGDTNVTSSDVGSTITPSPECHNGGADVSITKTVDDANPSEGDTIKYTITVTDLGPAESKDVIVRDTLPSGITYVSGIASQGDYHPTVGSWNVGKLSASSSATLVIIATVNAGTAGDTITNTAKVSESGVTDPNPVNNTASATIKVAGKVCTHVVVAVDVVGGTAKSSDFAVMVTGNNPDPSQFQGSSVGTDVSLGAGPYNVTEPSPLANYDASYSSACSGTIQNGDHKRCVITDTYVPTIAIADIGITKTVDNASPNVGDEIRYTLTATDFGPATSTGVVATDTLPSGLTLVSGIASQGRYNATSGTWTVGKLSASSSATLVITATVNAGTAGDMITNTATIGESSAETDNNSDNNTASTSLTVQGGGGGENAHLNVVVLVSGGTATSSDFAVAVTGNNPSPSQFQGSAAGITVTLGAGSYAVTESSTAPANYTPSYSSDCTGTVASGDSKTCTITDTYNTLPVADIGIAKTVDKTNPAIGDTINYTLTATNSGPATSTGVVATDTLPEGLTFVSDSSSEGTYSSSTGSWTIGTVSVGSPATLVISARVNAGTAGDTITNTATIGESSAETDNNSGNNTESASLTVQGGGGGGNTADIAIVKTVDNTNPIGGSTVTYAITVTDLGPGTSTIVDAKDQLPMGLNIVSATTSVGTYNSGSGDWYIGTLGPNATATLTIVTEVGSNMAGQTITNTATVSQLSSIIDPNPSNNSYSVAINVQSAGCTGNCGGGGGGGGGGTPTAEIAVTKSVDNASPSVGATIHYTIMVSALGPSASFGVNAADMLPSGLTFVSASTSAGIYNSTTGSWNLGTMVNGASATLTITATVNAGTNGETITNTATVGESNTVNDPNTQNDKASVSITVGGANGGGGQVLGASTSTIPATSTPGSASCGLYLTKYIHPVRKFLNDPTEVKKLQSFLNQNLGLNLAVSGDYDSTTIAAVDKFQVKYHSEVLSPWLSHGLPTEFTPTEYVYKTTQRWINLIMCPPLNLVTPQLP